MPRVPTYDAPQVALGGASNARFVSPEANNAAGQQLTELGNTMQKAGMTGARIAEQQQHLADETVLTDALTKVKERALALQHDKDTGFLQVRGATPSTGRTARAWRATTAGSYRTPSATWQAPWATTGSARRSPNTPAASPPASVAPSWSTSASSSRSTRSRSIRASWPTAARTSP